MNERIKELAKQTGYIWHASGDPQIYEFTPEKLKKFAELIVKECAHLVGGYVKEDEFGTDVKEAYEEITKHFGVEQ